jgi:hypothetical protein
VPPKTFPFGNGLLYFTRTKKNYKIVHISFDETYDNVNDPVGKLSHFDSPGGGLQRLNERCRQKQPIEKRKIYAGVGGTGVAGGAVVYNSK